MLRSIRKNLARGLWLGLAWGLAGGLALAQQILPNGLTQFTDGNGAPLAGGSVYFYIPSTTTPKTTWTDATEATPNSNPVVLDGNGRAPIWGAGNYREIVKDVNGNQIWDRTTAGADWTNVTIVGGQISGVTISSSTITGTSLAANSISNTQLAQMNAQTLKGNPTGTIANAQDASLSSYLDGISSTVGGVLARGASVWVALTGTQGQVLTSNGTGASTFSAPATVTGYSGLKITIPSNTTVGLVANALVLYDTNGIGQLVRTVSHTINGAVNGANGLDAGSLSASAWYAVYEIAQPNGTKAGLLSTSATAPTLPSGYTTWAREGWVRTDGSSHFIPTIQTGNRVQYIAQTSGFPVISTGATAQWTGVAVSSVVPTTASQTYVAIYSVNANVVSGLSANGNPTNNYDGLSFTANGTGTYSRIPVEITLESSSIYWFTNAGTLYCLGWTDNL